LAARNARQEQKFLQRIARLQRRMKTSTNAAKPLLLSRSQSA
jgi:hypothetical protein